MVNRPYVFFFFLLEPPPRDTPFTRPTVPLRDQFSSIFPSPPSPHLSQSPPPCTQFTVLLVGTSTIHSPLHFPLFEALLASSPFSSKVSRFRRVFIFPTASGSGARPYLTPQSYLSSKQAFLSIPLWKFPSAVPTGPLRPSFLQISFPSKEYRLRPPFCN